MSEANLMTAFSALKGKVDVHLEAGELVPLVRETIAPLAHRGGIFDPKRNSWIAHDPQKCDRSDANELADLMRVNRLREVPLSEAPQSGATSNKSSALSPVDPREVL